MPTVRFHRARIVLREIAEGFLSYVGVLLGTFVAAYAANLANLVHIDFALQVALSLLLGNVALIVVLFYLTARQFQEKVSVEGHIHALKKQLDARPRHWVLVEDVELRLTENHQEETIRFEPPIPAWSRLSATNGGYMGEFDVELSRTLSPGTADHTASKGVFVIDTKRSTPNWGKSFQADPEALYYVRVRLPDGKGLARVWCTVEVFAPVTPQPKKATSDAEQSWAERKVLHSRP